MKIYTQKGKYKLIIQSDTKGKETEDVKWKTNKFGKQKKFSVMGNYLIGIFLGGVSWMGSENGFAW